MPPERRVDLRGQRGERRRAATEHRAGAERLGEQRVVDVGAPGQAVGPHLLRHEPAGRLGGDEQPHPRVGGPAQLRGMDPDDVGELVTHPPAREQRRRPVVVEGRVGLRDAALEPRHGGGEAVGLPEVPVRAHQQSLGELDVVRAGDRHPGVDQAAVGAGPGEHPPRRAVPLQVRDVAQGRQDLGWHDDGAVVPQPLHPRRAVGGAGIERDAHHAPS